MTEGYPGAKMGSVYIVNRDAFWDTPIAQKLKAELAASDEFDKLWPHGHEIRLVEVIENVDITDDGRVVFPRFGHDVPKTDLICIRTEAIAK